MSVIPSELTLCIKIVAALEIGGNKLMCMEQSSAALRNILNLTQQQQNTKFFETNECFMVVEH